MDLAIIFDLAIVILFLVFAVRGAGKGLLLSLCGLLAVAVAFIGGRVLADVGADAVSRYLEPRFASAIEERLNEEIHRKAAETGNDATDTLAPEDLPMQDVLNVLKDMGLYKDLIATIEKAVDDGMTQVAASAAAAVAAAIAHSVAYMILFLIGFAMILILWTILSHTLDLVARLPGLNSLNRIGGALLGLIKCCVILFLAAWVLRYSGNLIPEETVAKTHLLKFFLTTNPVVLLLGP